MRQLGLGLMLAAALQACGDDAGGGQEESAIASKLTRELVFPEAMLLNGPLPETTAPEARLLPLGPTAVLEPDGSSIMALEIQDPQERTVEATLIRFEDADSYLRVPADEGEGASYIENAFMVGPELCEGLCDAIFTVSVTEKIELVDGNITSLSTRQIVVDCREHGDPEACDDGPGAGGASPALLCGDVTAGELAFTGERVLDSHLEAVRLLGSQSGALESGLTSVRRDLAEALGLERDTTSADVAAELTAQIEQQTESGLSLLLGEQGCGLRRPHVALALRSCDPAAPAPLPSLACSGVCLPETDASACTDAESSGCRGLLEGDACAGRCVGSCLVTLDEPTECIGTCLGTCDGECPGGSDTCAGPCTGLCTGECRQISNDTCADDCTGLCDETTTGVPECSGELEAYCGAPADASLACAGDCFGDAALDAGAMICRASALAIARSLPRCEPALVQLSFAFGADVDAATQNTFANLVEDLNTPLVRLFVSLARIDMLVAASAELLPAAQGEIADHLAMNLESNPDDEGLACAEQRLAEAAAWLQDQPAALEALRAEAMELLSPVTLAE